MRTTLDIDGKLLKDTLELSGEKTKAAAVEAALREYVIPSPGDHFVGLAAREYASLREIASTLRFVKSYFPTRDLTTRDLTDARRCELFTRTRYEAPAQGDAFEFAGQNTDRRQLARVAADGDG